MTQTLSPATSLSGTVLLPGDKSISHRYAMLAAIAEEISVIENFAASRDWETRQFERAVTDWELARYLEII